MYEETGKYPSDSRSKSVNEAAEGKDTKADAFLYATILGDGGEIVVCGAREGKSLNIERYQGFRPIPVDLAKKMADEVWVHPSLREHLAERWLKEIQFKQAQEEVRKIAADVQRQIDKLTADKRALEQSAPHSHSPGNKTPPGLSAAELVKAWRDAELDMKAWRDFVAMREGGSPNHVLEFVLGVSAPRPSPASTEPSAAESSPKEQGMGAESASLREDAQQKKGVSSPQVNVSSVHVNLDRLLLEELKSGAQLSWSQFDRAINILAVRLKTRHGGGIKSICQASSHSVGDGVVALALARILKVRVVQEEEPGCIVMTDYYDGRQMNGGLKEPRYRGYATDALFRSRWSQASVAPSAIPLNVTVPFFPWDYRE